MKLQEQVNAKCGECGSRKEIVQHELYGCDWCGGDIDVDQGHMRAEIFHHGDGETDHLQFCSWACTIARMETADTDYFATLPYLYFEEDSPKPQRYKEFFSLFDFAKVQTKAGRKMGRDPRKKKS